MRIFLAVVAGVAVLAVAACDRSGAAGVPNDAGAAAVTAALNKRFAALQDFELAGTAEQGSEKLPYGYAMKQPSYVRASVGDNLITFDGKAMLVVDGKNAERRDLTTIDEESRLLMMHQAFARFTCEGWRPPLLRPNRFSVATDGGRWVVTVPIDDDTLKEQRLILKAPGAELVEKDFVDKSGKIVMSTKVTAELTDPATHLVFPAAWESSDSDGNQLKIHVDKAVVNAGMPAARFSTEAK